MRISLKWSEVSLSVFCQPSTFFLWEGYVSQPFVVWMQSFVSCLPFFLCEECLQMIWSFNASRLSPFRSFFLWEEFVLNYEGFVLECLMFCFLCLSEVVCLRVWRFLARLVIFVQRFVSLKGSANLFPFSDQGICLKRSRFHCHSFAFSWWRPCQKRSEVSPNPSPFADYRVAFSL